ncbi:MAG TPA: ATP-binding protein [Planctomycetaceae bacterium]|nr:ATP-binding protein [Planctomycetaceae bacterium]
MSYRTIKRLLGETSLERKCRFLFGSGLLTLITISFYFYARQTTDLVFTQNQVTARLLVAPVILEKHWEWSERGQEFGFAARVSEMATELKPSELKEYNWALMDMSAKGFDSAEWDDLDRIRNGEKEIVRIVRDKKRHEYHYYGGVYASESCIACHQERRVKAAQQLAKVEAEANGSSEVRNPDVPPLKIGDPIGMVKISFPMEKTQRSLAWNNAILLATAIVTAFLAMLAAYAIVRYVIVKPVLHLKEVSDNIARGALDQRADIRTGDEFEELSHAFNRMLRHLVTVQEELQAVNQGYEQKNDELAQANLRLFELNHLKNDFLATMSHELRTPLNSILGFSDVLEGSTNLNDKQRRYVNHIQTSGKNLLTLINDVLDLAKIESGKMERHPVEFSIQDLVERMVGAMLPLAERKNLDLGWDVDPRVPVLWQDPGKIQQILNNLLSNAIKFTPDGGRVRVYVELRDPATVAVIVEDTGVGIPLEEQERIFEKFRQGKTLPGRRNALTREYEGTGLGLSIVRELAKLLGGDVHLVSEFGKGSVFTITLPVRLDVVLESPSTVRNRLTHETPATAGV